MRRRLTPQELSVLRRLSEQVQAEDPGLARQLQMPGVRSRSACSPPNWPTWVFVASGLFFLLAGVILNLGSAVLAGLTLAFLPVLRTKYRSQGVRAAMNRWEDRLRRLLS